MYKRQNLCRVCVDAWAGGEVTGRLYHCYSKQPEPIGRTSDVLDSIDRLCDRLNYPARTQQPRYFGLQRPRPQPQTTQKKVEPQMTRDEPVSYTHLDVYKRQLPGTLPCTSPIF